MGHDAAGGRSKSDGSRSAARPRSSRSTRWSSTARRPALIRRRPASSRSRRCGSSAGRVDVAGAFRRLVRPDGPIPAAAVAVHHIDDGMVADAPAFDQVWPELAAFMGDAVLIGHSLGFDLAVLKRECERTGNAIPAPAHARYPTARPGRPAQPCELHARGAVILARCRDQGPPFGARRCGRDGPHLLCARAQAA